MGYISPTYTNFVSQVNTINMLDETRSIVFQTKALIVKMYRSDLGEAISKTRLHMGKVHGPWAIHRVTSLGACPF
jgi:hypothetical protein